MTLILIFIFLLAIVVGVPVGFSMAFATIISFFVLDGNMTIIASRLFNGMDNFQFACIPFFILASEIMTDGGITVRIVKFCKKLVGHVPGGLAHVNVLGSMFFAGMSGSANADAAGLGKLEIEMMTKAGFPRDFSASMTAASAIIGPIIPPSTVMVIYCIAAQNVSITSMFLGGILPGILIGVVLMIAGLIVSLKNHYPREPKFAGWKAVFKSFFQMLPAVFMPFLILGGILGGAFTPTESAIVACVYAFFVSTFLFKNMTRKKFYQCVLRTAKTTATVFFIVAIAISMGWAITTLRIPQTLSEIIMAFATSKVAFLIISNIILLILGMVMDLTPAMLVMTPILLPIAVQYGISPIHFGIIVCINLCIGLITPPVGMVLFITSNVGKIGLSKLYRAIWPYVGCELIALMIITFVPWLSTAIPAFFGY